MHYGFVFITAGKNKGKTGYYDDDEDYAIVYLGNFLEGPYIKVKYSSMREATREEAEAFVKTASWWQGAFNDDFPPLN